jgi:hypothetical protein
MPLRPRRKQWPGRWRARVGVSLVLVCAALSGGVPVAAASSSDVQATHAYLLAQYRLVTALLHDAPVVRGAEKRRGEADRSRMPRSVVGDATGTVPVPGATTPCQG